MVNSSGIVDSARRGDLFAFQNLVERYQAPISRYLFRLVGDRQSARDLSMATFITARRRLRGMENAMRFEAWLFRVATQEATSFLRWQSFAKRLPGQRTAAPDVEDDQATHALQTALGRLPRHAAVALLLLSVGGFSFDEAGQITRLSAGALRKRLAEGRRRLRPLVAAESDAQATETCNSVAPLLSPYLDHQTSPDERRAVEDHLPSCAHCQRLLSDYQEIDRRLARLKSRGPTANVSYDVMRLLRGEKGVAAPGGAGRRAALAAVFGLMAVILLAGGATVWRMASRSGLLSPDAMLYVGLQSGEGQVAVVDVRAAQLAATIPLGARPLKLAAARDGSRIYVLGENSVVSVIDGSRLLVIERYQIEGRAAGLALSPDDKTLYVTLTDRRMLIYVDAATGWQFGETRVGRTPREIVASPDGQWLLVFNSSDNSLSKVRVSTRLETKLFSLRRTGDSATEFSSHPMAVSADSRKLYISELNRERVWTLDLQTDELRSFDVPLRDLSRDIAVAPAGDRIFLTHGDPRGAQSALAGLASMVLPKIERTAEIRGYYYGVAASPDGAAIFATNPDDNSVIIADAKTLQTTAAVSVGQRPTFVVYAPKVK